MIHKEDFTWGRSSAALRSVELHSVNAPSTFCCHFYTCFWLLTRHHNKFHHKSTLFVIVKVCKCRKPETVLPLRPAPLCILSLLLSHFLDPGGLSSSETDHADLQENQTFRDQSCCRPPTSQPVHRLIDSQLINLWCWLIRGLFS